MSGRIGDLSETQAKALRSLRERVPDQPQAEEGDLLRFLRARNFDVEQAHAMLEACLEWRRVNKVDDILDGEVPLGKELKCVVVNAYYGFDKEGSPIYIERTGTIDVDHMIALPADEMDRRHIHHMETLVRKTKEGSERMGRPVETISAIMDVDGIGLGHAKCLGIMKRVSQMDAANYPERMGRTFIINAPDIFASLWSLAKKFLDPVTADKFVILNPNQRDRLLDYIDADQLPEEFGGTACGVLPPSREYIPRYKKLERRITLEEDVSGRVLNAEWSFRVSPVGYDVLFAVFWKEGSACEERENDGTVVEVQRRVSSSDGLVSGSYRSLTSGTIHLVWEDDSYSWYNKMINYELTSSVTISKEQQEPRVTTV